MKVKAKARGTYGGRIREEGEEFDLNDAADFGSWMEPMDRSAEKAKAALDEKRAQAAARERAKRAPVLAIEERSSALESRLAELEAKAIDMEESAAALQARVDELEKAATAKSE